MSEVKSAPEWRLGGGGMFSPRQFFNTVVASVTGMQPGREAPLLDELGWPVFWCKKCTIRTKCQKSACDFGVQATVKRIMAGSPNRPTTSVFQGRPVTKSRRKFPPPPILYRVVHCVLLEHTVLGSPVYFRCTLSWRSCVRKVNAICQAQR